MGNIHVTTPVSRRRPAVAGMRATTNFLDRLLVLINANPQAKELYTLVVDTATNSEDYGVNLTDPNDASVVYSADAGTSKAEIADGLEEAWNESPLCRAIAVAASNGVDTVTFTGVYEGVAFTMEEDENAAKITLTNTTNAAEADSVAFGRGIVSLSVEADEADEYGILAKSSALTAQVETLAVTYAAGELYGVSIEIEGEEYGVEVAADTDTATTHAAIVAAINAIMPANSVLAAGASPSVTLTAEVAGKGFKVKRWLKSGTVARLTLTHTTDGIETDITRCLRGVSLYTYDEAAQTVGGDDPAYPANAGVEVIGKGLVWVENTQSPSMGDDVYIELGVTADNGKFFNTSSATRVKLPSSIAQWRRSEFADSDGGVALLAIDCNAL